MADAETLILAAPAGAASGLTVVLPLSGVVELG
jgi:hypothetical protein